MDWFELMRLIGRGVGVAAKAIAIIRTFVWLLDRWNDDHDA